MKNLKLAHKLIAGFGVVLLAMLGVALQAIPNVRNVGRQSDIILSENLPRIHLAGEMKTNALGNYYNTRAVAKSNSPEERARIEADMRAITARNAVAYKQYEATIQTDQDRALLADLGRKRQVWMDVRKRILALAAEGKSQEAVDLFDRLGPSVIDPYLRGAEEIVDLNRRNGEANGAHIRAALGSLTTGLWGGVVLGLILGVAGSIWIGRSITGPVSLLLDHVTRMGAGDLDSQCSYQGRDEVGRLASAMNQTSEDLRAGKAADVERIAGERAEREELQRKVDVLMLVVQAMSQGDLTQRIQVSGDDGIGQLAGGLTSLNRDLNQAMSAISQNSQTLAAASEKLQASARQMAEHVRATSGQASSVSTAAEEVSRSVGSVAAAAEQMTASVKEVSKNARDATRVSQAAVQAAQQASSSIAKLGQSSSGIGQVIKVITSIAQQTNLLALNATIEAARAGEAGKGFAVVANEVKDLARETAIATDDIGKKVAAIQGDTTVATSAVEQIRITIGELNDIAAIIAGSVEEQTTAINAIARNVSEAAQGVAEIATHIGGVAKTAEASSLGTAASMEAVSSLAVMASSLQELVGRFRLESDAPVPPDRGRGRPARLAPQRPV